MEKHGCTLALYSLKGQSIACIISRSILVFLHYISSLRLGHDPLIGEDRTLILLWIYFLLFILMMLILDLGVFHREPKDVSITEALGWTLFWVSLALMFNVGIYFIYKEHWMGIGNQPGLELSADKAALQFFTGYLIEKSLSLDNVFVIALIFSYFKVPLRYQHRVLFWGILGAIVLRGIMISVGIVLIRSFNWIVYVFGIFLIYTAVKMLVSQTGNLAPEQNPAVKLAKHFFPVSHNYNGENFFTSQHGEKAMTPLFLALVLVESSDILFAVDSIPAILAITSDPFLVYTSNIFAILGLRSLYFVLAGIMRKFQYLKTSLSFILVFIGIKMLLTHHYPIPTQVSLSIIAGILLVGILASVLSNRKAGGF